MTGKFTPRDRGHVQEIKLALQKLEKDYQISLADEIEWLENLDKRFAKSTVLEQTKEEIKRNMKMFTELAKAAAEKNLPNTLEANELLYDKFKGLLIFIESRETLEEKDCN